jgi:hypothetical protein
LARVSNFLLTFVPTAGRHPLFGLFLEQRQQRDRNTRPLALCEMPPVEIERDDELDPRSPHRNIPLS